MEKVNPFMQIVEAIKAHTTWHYYKLRRQSTGSKMVFSLLVALIACLFTFGLGGFRVSHSKNIREMMEEMPEFTYLNGDFTCEYTTDQSYGTSYLVMDTSVDAFICKDQENSDAVGTDVSAKIHQIMDAEHPTTIMFVSKTNILNVRMMGSQYEYQNIKYKDIFETFNIFSFSKTEILNGYAKFIQKCFNICGVVVYPFRWGGIFFYSLLWSLLGLIINAIKKGEQEFPTLYWISFYMHCRLLLILALFKVYVPVGSAFVIVAYLIYYVIAMSKMIEKGDPYEKIAADSSNNWQVDEFGGNMEL